MAGRRCGQGSCTYVSGDRYTGAWQDDLYHGQGSFYNARQGITCSGEFSAGKLPTEVAKLNLYYIQRELKKLPRKASGRRTQDGLEPVLAMTVGEPSDANIIVAGVCQVRSVGTNYKLLVCSASACPPAPPARGFSLRPSPTPTYMPFLRTRLTHWTEGALRLANTARRTVASVQPDAF